MGQIAKVKLPIVRGETFSHSFLWTQDQFAYRAIDSITQAAPCVITATAHGMPDGWPFHVFSAKGMASINSRPDDDDEQEHYFATVIDADNIEINDLISLDFGQYTGGGTIRYKKPVDLTGYTARAHFRPAIGGELALPELNTGNSGIVIDVALSEFTIQIPETDTADMPDEGVWSFEAIAPSGKVYPIAGGEFVVETDSTE